MAKAAANPAELEAKVRPILVALATADDEVRLLGAGNSAPLLAKKTGPGKAVYDHLTDAASPLLTVRKQGRDEFARPTAAGFLLALPHLPAERVGESARRFAATMPPAERLTFLVSASKGAGAEAAALLAGAADALAAELEAQTAADARRRQAERTVLDRLVAIKRADADRLGAELSAARSMLAQLATLTGDGPPGEPDEPSPPPAAGRRPDPGPPPVPTDPDDFRFRRQVLRGLATQWLEAQDHGRDEARRYLEAALRNLGGVRPIGSVGETVRFDGAVHSAAGGVSDDQPVRVVRVGWELEEDDGPFTVLKAKVE